MSPPATSWTEHTAPQQGWQDFAPPLGAQRRVILFGAALVMGGAQAPITPTWAESSVAAASYTEASVAATTWTEQTL